MAHMISPHLPLTVNTTLHHHHHHHHSLYSLNNFLPSSSPITHTSIHSRPTTPFFSFNNPLISLTQNNTRTCRSRVSFLQLFQTKSEDLESLKQELLECIAPLDRGADATPEQQDRVDQIARKLEAVNKIKEPLKSDLLNGKWELLYTTSQSILQTKRPKILRANGKIYQAINADTLRAQNMETWPFFNQALKLNNYDDEPSVKSHGISISSNFTQIDVRALQAPRLKAGNKIDLFPQNGRWNFNNKATANLAPLNTKRVAVKFDAFKVFGLIPIKARGSGRGQLEITYLDEELRISRGNEGNLFILRMVDPTYRVPL